VGSAAEGAQKRFGVAALLAEKPARRRQPGDDEINTFVSEIGDNPVAPLFGDVRTPR
jgi:hypothetical protein